MKVFTKRNAAATTEGSYDRAYDFLRSRPTGVLSTVDPNGEPHGAVIYYGISRADLALTFLTKKDTKKSDNLAHKNHAMLTVFDEKLQTVVQVTGRVTQVTDDAEISLIFRNALRASLHTGWSAVPPVSKLPGNAFIAYRLQPVQIRISAYGHTDVRGQGPRFEVIDVPH
jgi:pyridoxine/pyridoxamine 5'-phosphate oxidase